MPLTRLPRFLAGLVCGLGLGCGGGEAALDGRIDGEGRDVVAEAPPPEYVEPLVPAIDLGNLGGPVETMFSGGHEFIRSVDGVNLVDPLDLPEEPVGPADERPQIAAADFTRDERASFHPHGEEVCASGCAASRHPTPPLSKTEYLRLMREFARGPLDETNPNVEALMFYGRQTEAWIEQLGTAPLSEDRAAFLRRELRYTHALISFRIVDEFGVVRTQMPPTRVPLDRRHVFEMETEQLPPLETSGTVKRVGLHHLWTRL